MSKAATRAICAGFFVFGGTGLADIPMVVTPVVPSAAVRMPALPTHDISVFEGVTQVVAKTRADIPDGVDTTTQSDVSAFGVPCEMDVALTGKPAAMIELAIFAPCQPHASVHVSHGGFAYQTQVSMTGEARVKFPALSHTAEVFVAVDEEVFERTIIVEDVDHFARVALAGVSVEDAELVVSARDKDVAVFAHRGVQVLSVDTRGADAAMTYRLTLRHRVTAENCDAPIHSQLRRILPGQVEERQILMLAAQDCRRVGDILELKNIVQDLKLVAH